MATYNTNKQNESNTERDTFNFNFSEQNATDNADRQQHNTMANTIAKNQILNPIHKKRKLFLSLFFRMQRYVNYFIH